MKKIVWTVLAAICACVAYAQEKDVTRFLGIPVDGSKSEMIQKLKEKGFKQILYESDILEGTFNGMPVNVYVATNGDKVYRIVVCDANTIGESDIKIRFNRLCSQFSNNPNYISLSDCSIPEDEDISYEMIVHKKRYEADFYQVPNIDSVAVANKVMNDFVPELKAKFTQEQLDNATSEVQSEVSQMAASYIADWLQKKFVWFKIAEHAGKYYIAIFYDNVYNQANGEDL